MKKMPGLKLNKKGSGIVTVLVAISFLTLMGTLVLMLTSTSVEMKVSDRAGKQVANDASAAMNVVRSCFQEVVSDSVSFGYSSSMKHYTYNQNAVQTAFCGAFLDNLKSYSGGAIADAEHNIEYSLVTGASPNYQYHLQVIDHMIREGNYDAIRDGEIVLSGTTDMNGVVKVNYSATREGILDSIVFKGVTVTYTYNGRTTSVTTDIRITCPNISYNFSEFQISGIPSFAIVAGGSIFMDITASTDVNGSAYSSGLKLSNGACMNFDYGTYVCNGDIDLYDTSAFVFGMEDPNSVLWAENINVMTYERATNSFFNLGLYSSAYIYNDLNLAGKKADAELQGKYYGFGIGNKPFASGNELYYNPDANTDAGQKVYNLNKYDASHASSILINNSDALLSFENLDELTLSGSTAIGENRIENSDFYKNGSGDALPPSSKSVLMGESAAARYSQMIYLAPVESINYTRPLQMGYLEDGTTPAYIPDDGHPSTNPDVMTEEEFNCFFNKAAIEESDELKAKYPRYSYYGFSVNDDFVFTTETQENGKKVEHKLSDYDGRICSYSYPMNNQYIVYYYVEFGPDDDGFEALQNRNEFFKDYARANPSAIQTWLGAQVDLYDGMYFSQTMGYIPRMYDLATNPISAKGAYNGIMATSTKYVDYYNNVCKTLKYSDDGGEDEFDSPFDYYVNREKIENQLPVQNSKMEFKNEDGQVVAVIVNGDYTYTGNPSSLSLIIATGTVTVQSEFTGLIMCGGDIRIKSEGVSLTSRNDAVENAFYAVSGDGEDASHTYDFVTQNLINNLEFSENDSVASDKITALITYENWTKN